MCPAFFGGISIRDPLQQGDQPGGSLAVDAAGDGFGVKMALEGGDNGGTRRVSETALSNIRIIAMGDAFARKWQIGSGDQHAERVAESCVPFETMLTEEQFARVEELARAEFETMTNACSA